MKKTIALFTFVTLSFAVYAQKLEVDKKSLVQDGITKLEILKDKEPIPYPPLRESDIFWSRRVWRVIDLRERMNYPLYYPTEVVQSRKSLVQALVSAIQSGAIKAYDTESDEFITELSPEGLRSRFEATDKIVTVQKLDGSGDTTRVIRGEFNWAEVKELYIKEDWFFDKHLSQMFVRIIGICPVRVYAKDLQTTDEEEEVASEMLKKQLFWVYYPEARKVLANTPCFVGESEVTQLSFDDLFQKRRFSSYIKAISNNQNNRQIHSYTRNGMEAMLESERLSQEIFNFESDLWEY
ncbi:MAG: gliding motility protein GldN [Prevotellaceae bacterium]|jgi:gliding motility associated protien GldN|nr:gliding motility protein GldN [Prevotellaceae bacterium]